MVAANTLGKETNAVFTENLRTVIEDDPEWEASCEIQLREELF